MGAEVPQLIMQGRETEAYERLGWYVEVFGKENFFVELQEHGIPELVEINKMLVPWADKFGLQLVVTNDVHYVAERTASPMTCCSACRRARASTKKSACA